MTKFLLSTVFCAMLFIFYTHRSEKLEPASYLDNYTSSQTLINSPLPAIPTVILSSKKAFPTAEGYGRYATGGRGGKIVAVTNLNSSGSGSLDAALKMTGRRIIVFKVSGTITHSGGNYLDIPYNSGNVTVAGETAPGDGILIKGGEVRISASNVIIRGLRIRQSRSSSGSNEDCINISAYNGKSIEDIIIDHCSLSWARDENLSMVGNFSGSTIKDVTIQNCIIAESNYGLLSYKKNENISVFRNLFIHNKERNIRSNHPQASKLQYEMVNNLVHGAYWRTNTSLGTKFTVLNNKYKASSKISSKGSTSVNGESDGTGSTSSTHAFIKGNIQISGQGQYSSNLSPYIKSYAYKTSGLVGSAIPANQIENKLLPHVGASFAKHDAVDSRLINQYKNGTGAMASSGSFPYIAKASAAKDNNNNYIPDSFESAHNITSNQQVKSTYNFGSYQVKNNAGYTALEIYMAYAAGDFDRLNKVDTAEIGGDKDEPEPENESEGDCDSGLNNEDSSISLSTGKLISGLNTAKTTATGTNGSPCALHLVNNKTGQPWAKYSIAINLAANGVRAGDKIFISLDGKDNKSGARIKVAQDNTPHTYLIDHGFTSNWSTYSKTITVPSDISTLDIWLYTNYSSSSLGSAVFDNLTVRKVGGTNSGNCRKGLANEDSSVDLMQGEMMSGLDAAKIVTTGTNGSPCALELTNRDNGQAWSKYSITINLAANGVRAGDKIFFSLDGKSNNSGVRVKMAQDNTPHTYLVDHGYSSNWSTYSKTITVPSGISTLDIWLYTNYYRQSSGSALFDNLIVKKEGSGSTSLKMAVDFGTIAETGGVIETLSAYPNPTRGDVNVSIPKKSEFVHYALYGPSGVLIKQGDIEGDPSTLPVSIPGDQQGMFILSMSDKNGETKSVKIIRK